MQRSVWKSLTFALIGFALAACADEGVGDPCIPESIPCDENGQNCGYVQTETYVEASSVQCRSRLCIVHKLDIGLEGVAAADPRVRCDANGLPAGCVTNEQLAQSVYCTCKCGGPETREHCECPSGYQCEEVEALNKAGEGIQGRYCVRPSPTN